MAPDSTRGVFLPFAVLGAVLVIADISPAGDSAEVFHGDVVIGVDSLGRVLAAVDRQPKDGVVDHFFLFTASERLVPAWEEFVEDGVLVAKSDELQLNSSELKVKLKLGDAQGGGSGSHFVRRDGVELVSQTAEDYHVYITTLQVGNDQSGWPLYFGYDSLDPGTGGCGLTCTAGGDCALSCSIDGCENPPTSCSVTCYNFFIACCGCFGTPGSYATCRCHKCLECG